MNWIDVKTKREYRCIEDFPDGCLGFVYLLRYSNGKKYLGSKVLYHKKVRPPLKGYKRRRRSIVESDWKKYEGSCKSKNYIEDKKNGNAVITAKFIVKLCYSIWEVNYHESRFILQKNCLIEDAYYNSYIRVKLFSPKKD